MIVVRAWDEELDRHRPMELSIARREHATHAASPEVLLDQVAVIYERANVNALSSGRRRSEHRPRRIRRLPHGGCGQELLAQRHANAPTWDTVPGRRVRVKAIPARTNA